MTKLTTVKVSVETRDELRSIAARDGITFDAALRKLLRAERQRQMGADLAKRQVSDDEQACRTTRSLNATYGPSLTGSRLSPRRASTSGRSSSPRSAPSSVTYLTSHSSPGFA